MRGGLGSGKSHAGARELMCGILENYQAMAARGGHGQMLYLVGGPSYDILEVGAWFHVCNWLDEFQRINGWKLDKRRLLSHPRKIELIGDLGVIKFISLDQPQKYAAATASGVWIDESELLSSSVEAWTMLQGRLRDNRAERRFMLATSSPRGSRGLAKMFEDMIANGNPSYGLVVSSSYDNPGNPKEYVDSRFTVTEHVATQPLKKEKSNGLSSEHKDVRILASKLVVDKFNEDLNYVEKYWKEALNLQKKCF